MTARDACESSPYDASELICGLLSERADRTVAIVASVQNTPAKRNPRSTITLGSPLAPPLSAAETMDPLRFTSPLLPATSLCRANFSTLLTFSQRWKRRPSAGWPALEKTGKPGNRTFDESLDITVFAGILAFLLFRCFFLCFLCFFAFVFVFFFLERSCMRWEKVREAIVSVELEIERVVEMAILRKC